MTESREVRGGMALENPFTLKVGQVFTGFGVGCGIGIGIGQPLNLGAIPVLDQVMRATSGATAAFSGVGQHTNNFIRKIGLKSIQAGVGCGVGFGHGFGAGLAIKPGAVHNIQICLIQGLTGIMKKLNITPDLPIAGKLGLPGSVKTSMEAASETAGKALQDPKGTSMKLASQAAEKVYENPIGKNVQIATQTAEKTFKESATGTFTNNSPGMAISNFLQGAAPQNTSKMDLDEGRRLQSENQILQMLLKHQQILEELKEENTAFRRALVEELNVSPDKLRKKSETENCLKNTCSDCFKCRRRARRRS